MKVLKNDISKVIWINLCNVDLVQLLIFTWSNGTVGLPFHDQDRCIV